MHAVDDRSAIMRPSPGGGVMSMASMTASPRLAGERRGRGASPPSDKPPATNRHVIEQHWRMPDQRQLQRGNDGVKEVDQPEGCNPSARYLAARS
jgi:hypothetical protein